MHPAPSSFPTLLRRRALAAALVALPTYWVGARAQAPALLRATPSQTEGPYYPVTLPADADPDLLRNGALRGYERGQPVWLEGTVTDLNGQPLQGAWVEIWQCDEAGHYHHPGDGDRADPAFQGFGRVKLGTDGRYRFRTIKPAPYSGRTPHIHMKVRLGQREQLTTQLYVEGDPGNTSDYLWRRLGADERQALTRPFVMGSDGLRVDFPVVIAT